MRFYLSTTSTSVIQPQIKFVFHKIHVSMLQVWRKRFSLIALQFICNHLANKGALSLKICTLLDKPSRRKPGVTVKADYTGFVIPNEFVVGYGLDFNEHYRNLPYVGILKPELYA